MAGRANMAVALVVAVGLAGAAYYFMQKKGQGGQEELPPGDGGQPPASEPPPSTPTATVSSFDAAYAPQIQ
ncbi:MAG: hypothetical protein Q8R28_23255 [Dehalococcoidia bacterium]|nr:hypothetical protein [Dehalococcoidia bacterium]